MAGSSGGHGFGVPNNKSKKIQKADRVNSRSMQSARKPQSAKGERRVMQSTNSSDTRRMLEEAFAKKNKRTK